MTLVRPHTWRARFQDGRRDGAGGLYMARELFHRKAVDTSKIYRCVLNPGNRTVRSTAGTNELVASQRCVAPGLHSPSTPSNYVLGIPIHGHNYADHPP